MSNRKGEVVLLDEAKNRVKEKMQQDTKGKFKGILDPDTTADNIAIAAIIIQNLSSRKIKDYKFDWKRVTQFEGKTGSYLQFTYARLCSLERINNIPVNISFIDEGNNDFTDTSNLLEQEIQIKFLHYRNIV
jgi:arginyl-tRNA synthetase